VGPRPAAGSTGAAGRAAAAAPCRQPPAARLLALLTGGGLPRAAAGEAIRTYGGHQKAAVCCALNDSAIDGRDGDS
jgi:hypothetical protein